MGHPDPSLSQFPNPEPTLGEISIQLTHTTIWTLQPQAVATYRMVEGRRSGAMTNDFDVVNARVFDVIKRCLCLCETLELLDVTPKN